MLKPTAVNRAPSFKRLFGSEEEFLHQRTLKAPFASQAKSSAAPAQFEQFKATKRFPPGFSMRSLGLEVAAEIGGRIVSEHEGLIDTMLIAVPRSTSAIDELDRRHYAALFRGLGPWVKYIVVCDPRQQRAVGEIAHDAGLPGPNLSFVLSPRFGYSIWAQDAYAAITALDGQIILCEGVCFPRYEDMTVADDVAAQSDVSVLQSYLYFQGGNVLGSSGVTLIGKDYVERNRGRFRLPDLESVVGHFEKLFGTDILPLGGTKSGDDSWRKDDRLSGDGHQPIFHIDMYVTPTGVRGQSGKEIVFLGRPEAARQATGRFCDAPRVDGARYDSFFHETEEQLATRFEVRHLPLWITHGELIAGKPRYYNLTFNNCIVQNAGATKRVLLPSYSEDAAGYGVDGEVRKQLESAAGDEWARLGFEVAWMDGLEDLAYASGAVHCITKTLRRRAISS